MIAVGTRPARPSARGLRRTPRHRLRRHPAGLEEAGPEDDDRRRRRGHRRRVRVDVRRHGHARHASWTLPTGFPSFVDREIAIALRYLLRRSQRVVPLQRGGHRRRGEDDRAHPRLEVGEGPYPVATRLMYADGRQGVDRGPGAREGGPGRATSGGRTKATTTPQRRCRTSSPWATSPARRAGGDEQWSRAASPRCARSASRWTRCPSWSRSASTRSRRSSYVGATEEELTEAAIPYVVGVGSGGGELRRRS